MNKPFFIRYTRKTEFGGTTSDTEYFEYAENRDIVLRGMQKNRSFVSIHAGKIRPEKHAS